MAMKKVLNGVVVDMTTEEEKNSQRDYLLIHKSLLMN